MGAIHGSLTYSRFTIEDSLPRDFRNKFSQAVRLRTFEPLTPEDEDQERSGWCVVGRAFDLELTADKIYEGPYLVLGLRIDRWRIPSAMLKARIAELVDKARAKSGREKLPKREVAELKALAIAKLRRKTEPSSKVIDVCWQLETGVVRVWTHSKRVLDDCAALFEKTFGLTLIFESPYSAAIREGQGRAELEALKTLDATPLHATPKTPKLPRKPAADSDLGERIETTRFLGNEYLAWLWCTSELCNGRVDVTKVGELELWFGKVLEFGRLLEPAERVTVRGTSPSAAPEAREALRQGKLPTKGRVFARWADREFTWQLIADRLAIAGAAIPKVLAADDSEAFLERMDLVGQLEAALYGLYSLFLRLRLGAAWERDALPILRGWTQEARVDSARFAQLVQQSGSTKPTRSRQPRTASR
jgi:recombination associated protein RdgC